MAFRHTFNSDSFKQKLNPDISMSYTKTGLHKTTVTVAQSSKKLKNVIVFALNLSFPNQFFPKTQGVICHFYKS